MKDNISNKPDNFYFFCLNSEQTTVVDKDIHAIVLEEANPNYFYYFYCIYTYTFTKLVRLKL